MTTVAINNVVNRVVVEESGSTVEVNYVKPQLEVTTVGVQGAQGIQGIQGVPGPNTIGGYTIEITSPQNGDLLQFNSTYQWVNSPQATVTDGGNF